MSGVPSAGWVQRRFDAEMYTNRCHQRGSLELTFDVRSPWAVGVILRGGDVELRRALLRQTLDRGLRGRVLSQGVKVWISPLGRLTPQVLHLCYLNETLLREWTMAVRPADRFLCDTYRLVPRGTEGSAIDLDVELTRLLTAE